MARVLIIILLLSGCAGSPGIRVETQTVVVEKPVACAAAADWPSPPAPLGPRPATGALELALAKLVEVFGERLDGSGGYVARVEAIRPGCTAPPQ